MQVEKAFLMYKLLVFLINQAVFACDGIGYILSGRRQGEKKMETCKDFASLREKAFNAYSVCMESL
jgi:hypothetical protein